jgi:hypothetical protein
MQWSDIQFRPPSKTLRQFALLWLACFGALALYEALVRGHASRAAVLAILALTIGPLGALWPRLVQPIYVAWMVLAFPIGWTISQLILAFMFYGLFTPVAYIFRLIGRDPLHRARQTGAETYWSPKPAAAGPRSYFKQF